MDYEQLEHERKRLIIPSVGLMLLVCVAIGLLFVLYSRQASYGHVGSYIMLAFMAPFPLYLLMILPYLKKFDWVRKNGDVHWRQSLTKKVSLTGFDILLGLAIVALYAGVLIFAFSSNNVPNTVPSTERTSIQKLPSAFYDPSVSNALTESMQSGTQNKGGQ
ncbi:hypothetical protein [Streptococcus sp. DD12]|uniref:hypothetical protein n=1 Tax=Streptococcus sp. DD12 TaxID=1777880 RepID=UPI0007954934|nr:hypothetical protein [Streptococcus sp. DD12]KXT75905.1 hypothetical protein STRDD12_01017 [Streptococcus sp. DD12]